MWHQKDITHPMRHRHTGHRDHKIQDLLNTMRHYETSYDHIRDHTTFEIPNTWNLNALWCLMMLHGLSICNNLCIKQCSYIRVTTVVSSCFFSPGIWKCPLSRMLMASCKHAWLVVSMHGYTHMPNHVYSKLQYTLGNGANRGYILILLGCLISVSTPATTILWSVLYIV